MTTIPAPGQGKRVRPARTMRALVAATAIGATLTFLSGQHFAARAEQLFNAAQPLGQSIERMSRAPLSFADIVKKVRPAVVSVNVKIDRGQASDGAQFRNFGNLPEDHPLNELFKRFFGQPGTPAPFRGPRGPHPYAKAQGSGFIISEDGYVVTNNHVVDKADEVEVILDDGTSLKADVIGTDAKTDLALLKIKAERAFPYVAFTGGDIEIGDWVVAVGNPFGLGGTVTAGIVSARGRDLGSGPYDDFIQIDASINKGNSGGPAFNLNGEVVGVNTAIFSPTGGSVGIGFAIPANIARDVIQQLKDTGTVTRGWLGVGIQPVDSDIAESQGLDKAGGAIVTEVFDGSPAKSAGLQSGDTIVAVNGDPVEDPKDLARRIGDLKPNSVAELKVIRGGRERTIDVTLGTQPARDEMAALSGSGEPDATRPETELTGLGLSLAPASDVEGAGSEGVVIVAVQPDSAAAASGLQVGDVILKVHDRNVSHPGEVVEAMEAAAKLGRKKALFRIRTGQQRVRFVALPVGKA